MKDLDSYIETMRRFFLTISEFGYYKENMDRRLSPMEKLVYGLTGLMLVGVIGVASAAITFYLRSGK